MRKEGQKSKKGLLWILIAVVALLAAGGITAAVLLGGNNTEAKSAQGRPQLYWNADRLTYTENSESGLSTREPGSDGVYRIRFAIDGEFVEYTATDKQLVNYIDSLEIMALTVDDAGQILDVQEPEEVSTVIGKRIYLQQLVDDRLVANSSLAMNGMRIDAILTEKTKIIDVTAAAQTPGAIVGTDCFLPMDTIGIYADSNDEVTHVFILEHTQESKIYWRAEQFYDSTLKQTTRVADENGLYSMEFYCEGELVTLQTRNRDIVNHVDSRDRYACAKGFSFDDEGLIVGEVDPALGTRTVLGCERFDVVELTDDGYVNTEKLWNPDGSVFSCAIAPDCVIYDVSMVAEAEGRRGKPVESLQLGDRVTIWTNPNGEATIIYVACRTVDVDIYYFPTSKYDSTLKETTRTPNAAGYYEVELLKVGESANRTFKTKDKALMSYLDKQNARTVGLITDGDIIQRVYGSECLFGYTPLTRGGCVPSVNGSVFSRMTYGQRDNVRNSILSPDCKIYNVSEVGQYGAETTLQEGDRIYAHRKPTGEAIFIFVVQRKVGLDHLYWNVGRQYDSVKKETTRTPDADGWYIFNMIWQGKQVTLKTKSKALASKIDAQSTCAIGLDVSGDVIVNAYSALNTSGGSVTMSGYRVKEIRSDGTVVVWYSSGDTYRERTFRIKTDGKIYNVSDAYVNRRGEQTSLRVGDMVLVVTDIYAEAEVVYVRYREADYMYYKADRYYDSSSKVTTRVPDADGWYCYDLAVNGTVKTFKTKDKELATKLDGTTSAFGLVVTGDEIRSYVPSNWVRGVGFVGVTAWEVTAINGNRVTVKYQLPGSSDSGKTQTIQLASGAKIYDVSPSAEKFGAVTELQVGDQIRTYHNEANTAHLYVYVLHHATRAAGVDGYCDHCGKTVHWNPYAGGSINRTDGHYYLSGNCETSAQLGVGIENADYEIVLDLNGKTLDRVAGGRFALVRFGDTLTVMDSAQGGAIRCGGAEGWNGGVMYVDGGHVNLMGGTLEVADTLDHKWGAVLYISKSTFTMSGGTLVGGRAQRGGAIYNTGASSIVMSGGTITDGYATTESGGNIYLMSDTSLEMSGGTISNGKSAGRGGNIHVDSAVLKVTGGTITGGTSERSADGICVNSSKSAITMENVICEDKILVRYMGDFTVSGSVKIRELEIPTGKKITVGKLEEGSRIGINAIGVFTEEFEDAAAYAEAGYFVSAIEGQEVYASGNALTLAGAKVYCPHCDKDVAWRLWSANATVEGTTAEGEADHYYLEEDFTQHTAQRTVKGNVVLDLRGHSYTTAGIRNFLVSGDFSVLDTVGGGVMTADGSGDDGTIAYVNVGGTFRLYSGTLQAGENANVKNGGVLAVNKGSVYIYGGTLVGGNITGNGSAVWNKSYGNLFFAGGTVNGSVYVVGSADNKAYLALSDCAVNGDISVGSFVVAGVNGAPVLSNLHLSGGAKLTLGELTDGADITVTAEGIFTEENEKAADYVGYFKSSDGQEITVTGNALRVGVETPPEEPEQILCPHCNSAVEWTLWPAITKPASGHYYIDSDFTAQTAQWSINAGTDVVLDLRGHSYAPVGIRNFLVSGTFSVVDTVGGGVMTADGSGDDGTIAYLNGAAAEFRLYGGTLQQGENPKVKNGGLLAANRGTIRILGGTLEGGTVTGNGNAIWNKRHVDVTVENATVNGSIFILGDDESNAKLNLKDASVNGTITVGVKTDVTLSGKTVLTDLELTASNIITLNQLLTESRITIAAQDGAFTAANPDAASYVTIFTPADSSKAITEKDGILYYGEMIAPPAEPEVFLCPHCEDPDVEWLPWPGTTKPASGHYYIDSDFTAQTAQWSINSGTDVVLDLRGHNYTTTGIRNFLVAGIFSIVDSEGTGTMCADGADGDGSIAYLNGATADFRVYGGTLRQGENPKVKNGGLLAANRGTIRILGGTLEGGTVTGNGNAIWNKRHVDVTIENATVNGDIFILGDDEKNASLTLTDADVTGTITVGVKTDVTVSGKTVVTDLSLTEGNVITLGDLIEGAQITVTATGIFTAANPKAAEYVEKGWILAVEGGQITESEGVLSMTFSLAQLMARIIKLQ